MKAAVYIKAKSGKVLQIMDIETPIPKDNEVLIKVRAASVNPLDWCLTNRRPGVDVAGEVVEVGKRVTEFKPRDTVFGACRDAFAEYACASESALVRKPENMTFEQAASAPIAGLTAFQGLRDKGDIQPGQNVLMNGAAGGIGTFAVQIAKSLGAEVTGVCSRGMSKWCGHSARTWFSTTRRKTSPTADDITTCSWTTSATALCQH
jgi:NADPH:quinone reductase-like Zn-dependent oxidoreductase